MTSHTLEKTDVAVTGHPRTVVSVQNSNEGKVYTASPDSPYMTILRTDEDIAYEHKLVTGNIVDVRVNTQNGQSGNSLNVSRIPGYGQPCNLPRSEFDPAANGTNATLANCQVQDSSLLE
jgi:hypothetical protein